MLNQNKNSKYTGLEIGESSIRVVEVAVVEGKPHVVSSAHTGLEGVADFMSREPQLLARSIKTLLNSTKSSITEVAVGLNLLDSSSFIMTTSSDKPDAMNAQVHAEVKKHFPDDYESLSIDWEPTGRDQAGAPSTEVLVVAAQTARIARLQDVLQMASLEMSALEINSVSLARVFGEDADTSMVIVNVQEIFTEVIVAQGARPFATSTVAVGQDTFIDAATQTLNLDPPQAEELIYKYGLDPSKIDGKILKAVKPPLDAIVSRIQAVLDEYQQHSPEQKITKLIVIGRVAYIPDFLKYVAEAFHMYAQGADPWELLQSSTQDDQSAQHGYEYSVATGLALRQFK